MIDGALSPSEVDELLGRPLLARLATIDDDGFPSVVPVWFEWADGAFWIVARARSAYVEHMRRDPHVGISVVADEDPDRRVQVAGFAEILDGPAPLGGRVLELTRRLAERYEGASGLAYVEETRDRPRILVRVRPERLRSWRLPEWHPRYRSPADGDPA